MDGRRSLTIHTGFGAARGESASDKKKDRIDPSLSSCQKNESKSAMNSTSSDFTRERIHFEHIEKFYTALSKLNAHNIAGWLSVACRRSSSQFPIIPKFKRTWCR